MDESESKAQEPKKERRVDPELLKRGLRCDSNQYEMLRRCSDKKDMTEWNEWRKNHFGEDVLLEGADLAGEFLDDVDLSDYGGIARSPTVCLKCADLSRANLRGASLRGADLRHANLTWARLEGVKFLGAYLGGAILEGAHLQGANFCATHLQGARFETALVDGATSFWKIEIDRETSFLGVSLNTIRIHPKMKQLLEYNIRRKNWEEWYSQHSRLKWLVKSFWWMSDYGRSTARIAGTFFILALVFAGIYAYCAYSSPPGIVSDLMVEPHLPQWHYFALVLIRPFYFSVVTMTTLGFGDMYADAESIWGHILLTIQVILGYVLLGALVTRFAVLFTAGGPAGEFADEKDEKEAKRWG